MWRAGTNLVQMSSTRTPKRTLKNNNKVPVADSHRSEQRPRFLKCFHVFVLLSIGRMAHRQFSIHWELYRYQVGDIQLLTINGDSPRMNHEVNDETSINSTLPADDSQIIKEHLSAVEDAGSADTGEPSRRPVFDVLTISSIERPEIVNAQRSTWGSHPTIRNFMEVNEKDDPDPQCRLKYNDTSLVDQYVDHCKRRRTAWPTRNNITSIFTSNFARKQWLQKKKNPGGWLCAQRRMAMGLAKLRAKYEKEAIPDLLVLSDDDMYLNVDLLETDLDLMLSQSTKSITKTNTNTLSAVEQNILMGGESIKAWADTDAKVYAGCLVISAPAPIVQFTFPYGGWGTFFTKGAIERLIQPLHCNADTKAPRSSFEEEACSRLAGGLHLDLLSESRYFEDGMSISDLMGALASNTKTPYCMHSDWAVGYFVNFYNISGVQWEGPDSDASHGRSSWYPDVPQTRIFPIGVGQKSWLYRQQLGNCRMVGENCNNSSLVCHYVSEMQMKRIHGDIKYVSL